MSKGRALRGTTTACPRSSGSPAPASPAGPNGARPLRSPIPRRSPPGPEPVWSRDSAGPPPSAASPRQPDTSGARSTTARTGTTADPPLDCTRISPSAVALRRPGPVEDGGDEHAGPGIDGALAADEREPGRRGPGLEHQRLPAGVGDPHPGLAGGRRRSRPGRSPRRAGRPGRALGAISPPRCGHKHGHGGDEHNGPATPPRPRRQRCRRRAGAGARPAPRRRRSAGPGRSRRGGGGPASSIRRERARPRTSASSVVTGTRARRRSPQAGQPSPCSTTAAASFSAGAADGLEADVGQPRAVVTAHPGRGRRR